MPQQTTLERSNRSPMRTATRSRGGSILLATTFAIGLVTGAWDGNGDPSSTSTGDALVAALVACHLYDGSVDKAAEIRACTPAEENHKTTICHIPPGNPGNAHTLCIGNVAVPAHLDNHGDYLGPCKAEQVCPPPPPSAGTGGAGDPNPGTGGQTGAAGSPAAGPSGAITIG
jgi:hypothetical protein